MSGELSDMDDKPGLTKSSPLDDQPDAGDLLSLDGKYEDNQLVGGVDLSGQSDTDRS